jgi:DNA-binding CsgD family transcriptional regulator
MDEKQFNEITSKMDTIIRLLALSIVRDFQIQEQKITALSSLGFSPSEIAKLLGTTQNTVSVTLNRMKKKTKKKNKTMRVTSVESKRGSEIEKTKVGGKPNNE